MQFKLITIIFFQFILHFISMTILLFMSALFLTIKFSQKYDAKILSNCFQNNNFDR